ncbi:DUF4305 domain-containing protein [Aquibacillus salsiterrae]|uniref:YdiK family protein n=1 Tax=Aquibacillus salsiterrae TaxID=2950439 RepID=A0A9X4AGE5_9BACI|nr:DUF4305 domain-containing protein [Aquibacillus salsiterrae]MDC3418599.1 YdiK family protein [Aquibacillus salsiterrae]
MRLSPLAMASFYFSMGVFFIYIAVQSVEDNLFNFITITLCVFATLDFVVSIRLVNLYFKIKRAKKNT